MSLGVVIKGPEGIVLAADSRVTLGAQKKGGPLVQVNFDNTTKLLSFSPPYRNVGVVTYGQAVIGRRTAYSFVPEFEVDLPPCLPLQDTASQALKVLDFAERLSRFFLEHWQEGMPKDYQGPGMVFIVGGYDPGDAYGKVFLFEIPWKPEPEARNPGAQEFGMTWGGQLQIASRIVYGFDPGIIDITKKKFDLDDPQADQFSKDIRAKLEFPIPYDVLPLQDCVDLATFLIRSTVTAQSFALGVRGVGGPIDVATITRTDGLQYIQRKIIRGEHD